MRLGQFAPESSNRSPEGYQGYPPAKTVPERRQQQRRVKAVTSHRTPHFTHSGSASVFPKYTCRGAYELAVETASRTPGVVCPNVAAPPLTLILGNQLLFERDADYPAKDGQKYGVRQHSVEVVVEAIQRLQLPPGDYCHKLPQGIDSALGVFIGYVMLDALVANQDRHHQNWGALRSEITMLAPTFDHGAALARNEPEVKRERRLHGPDPRYNIEHFAQKATSSFYSSDGATRPLRTFAAFQQFALASPAAAQIWLHRLGEIDDASMSGIIERIPQGRMSPLTREFTIELIKTNQSRLLSS